MLIRVRLVYHVLIFMIYQFYPYQHQAFKYVHGIKHVLIFTVISYMSLDTYSVFILLFFFVLIVHLLRIIIRKRMGWFMKVVGIGLRESECSVAFTMNKKMHYKVCLFEKQYRKSIYSLQVQNQKIKIGNSLWPSRNKSNLYP